jgi:predicted RNA-binding protein YlqC (UPF0109 family)
VSDQELDRDEDEFDDEDVNFVEDDADLDDGDDDDDDHNANEVVAANATAVLEYLVRAVVDDPDSVEVDVDGRGRRPALNVTVAPGDMGRVIGKRGRVATAIRTVTRAAAVRDDVEVDIEFLD